MTILSKEDLSSDDLKILRDLYWTLTNEAEKRYECNECKLSRVKCIGRANLDSHLFIKHKDWQERLVANKKTNNMNSFFLKASRSARNLHDWLEWMVMNDESPTYWENKHVKKIADSSLSLGRPYLNMHTSSISVLRLRSVNSSRTPSD